MSAICPSVFGAIGRNSNSPSPPPPLLRRESANQSWRGCIFGRVKSLFGQYPARALAGPMKRTGAPEEPPGETEVVSCMVDDPVFWMMVLMH
jgi:hypothetical protein